MLRNKKAIVWKRRTLMERKAKIAQQQREEERNRESDANDSEEPIRQTCQPSPYLCDFMNIIIPAAFDQFRHSDDHYNLIAYPDERRLCAADTPEYRQLKKAFKKIHKITTAGTSLKKLKNSVLEFDLPVRGRGLKNKFQTVTIKNQTAKFIYRREDEEDERKEELGLRDMYPSMLLTVEFESSWMPRVYWARFTTPMVDGVSFSEQKLTKVESKENTYRATFRQNNFNPTYAAPYYYILENHPAVQWSYFNVDAKQTPFLRLKLEGDQFKVRYEEGTICGVNLYIDTHMVHWRFNGEPLVEKDLNVVSGSIHKTLPSGHYALLDFKGTIPKGVYSCIIIDEHASHEVIIDPHANVPTKIIAKPIAKTKFYMNLYSPVVKLQAVVLVEWQCAEWDPYTEWKYASDSDDFKFMYFETQRYIPRPNTSIQVFTFEVLYTPVGPEDTKTFYIKFDVKPELDAEPTSAIIKFGNTGVVSCEAKDVNPNWKVIEAILHHATRTL